MSKVILKGYIIVPTEDLPMITEALAKHIELTRSEEGCLVFEITQSETQKQRFELYEEFVDQAAFQKHQERSKASVWGDVSQNIERHYEVIIE